MFHGQNFLDPVYVYMYIYLYIYILYLYFSRIILVYYYKYCNLATLLVIYSCSMNFF